MKYLLTWKFWDDTLERTIRSMAQTLLAVWFVGDRMANVVEFDWALGAGVAAASGLLTILTAIAAASPPAPGETGNPSVLD